MRLRRRDADALRVLLVTHEASLTGAPRIALLAAGALLDEGHQVSILSRRPGPMEPDFRARGSFSVEPLHRVRRRLRQIPGLRWLAWIADTVLAFVSIARSRPGLVYLNSTASLIYLRPALWLRRPVIVHSHESAAVSAGFVGSAKAGRLLRQARLGACSPSARTDLAATAGVPVSAVELVLSVPDSDRVLQSARTGRCMFDVVPGEIVIGCCGSVEHRKGADLWLEVEQKVRAEIPGVRLRFVWIGAVDASFEGVAPDRFIGPAAQPYASMSRFDIATLPSRDDPFPLVVMEAMLLGKPVVAFDVGGVAEQIGNGGVVVRAGDVAAFAAAIVQLAQDSGRREELGHRAAARAAREYSVEAFVTAVSGVVDSLGPHPSPHRPQVARVGGGSDR